MSSTPIFNPVTAGSANTVNGNLEVTGNAAIDRNLLVKGNETVVGNLTVSGSVTAGSVTYTNLNIPGNLTVGGTSTTTGTSTIGGSTLTGSGTPTAIQLPATSGTLALTSQLPSGTVVTTTTINNNTLPASLTTLSTSGAATLASATVGGSNVVTNTTLSNNTLPASLTTLSTSGGATLASATVGGSNVVTNTTLNNSTLPASFTTLNASGNTVLKGTLTLDTFGTSTVSTIMAGASAAGQFFTDTSVSDTVVVNNPDTHLLLGFGGGGTVQQSALKLTFPYVVSTKNNTLDNGTAGNASFLGTVNIGGSTITGTAATAIQMPASSGTLALTSQLPAGTAVTTTTINNNSLPASFTTLATSGAATLASATVGGSNVVTNTTLSNSTLPASFTTLATTGAATLASATVGGSNVVTNTTINNATLPAQFTTLSTTGSAVISSTLITGGTISATNGTIISGSMPGLQTSTSTVIGIGSGVGEIQASTGGAVAPLQLNPAGGTVAIGNSVITGSGSATAISMPSSSGTLQLAPNYISATSNTVSGGFFTTYTTIGSRGVTVSGSTFTVPAGTYIVQCNANGTSPATTAVSVGFTPGTGPTGATAIVGGSDYNTDITARNYSVSGVYTFTSTAPVTFQVNVGGYTTASTIVYINQLL